MLPRLITSHPKARATAGLALVLGVFSLLDTALIRLSYDSTFGLADSPTVHSNSPVVLVYLDLASYLKEKQGPEGAWSRALHARLVRRLTEANARAVVFDIIFDTRGKDPVADQEFADAIRANGRVVLGAELDFSTLVPASAPGVRRSNVVLPQMSLLEASAAWGLAKFAIDRDLVVRRFFPGRLSQDQPSLTWATASLLNLPGLDNELIRSGRGWLRYYGGPLSVPHVSYSDALDATAVSGEFFRDKIVFVGARPIAGSFWERKDEFRNPVSAWEGRDVFMPAVEIHATQMLNLVRGDWLRRWPAAVEAWLLVFSAVVCSGLLLRFRPLPATAIALGLEAAVVGGVIWAFAAQRVWFPWLIVAAVQIPGALLGSLFYHSAEWYRTRRRLEALRRQAEGKIREQAALIDKAQDAILVLALDGGVVYANPSAERLYGWKMADLARDGAMQQLFAPAGLKFKEAREAVVQGGEWQGELEQATRGGQKLIVESRWTLIRDEAGKPVSILLINTDVTDKKKLEAQFLRAQRLDTIGAVAGGMAHDLNNALSPILMGIQLIRRKTQDEESRQMLSVMEANTHRGAEMVRQVLTFSRGHEGERELLKVGQLIREMEHVVRQVLPRSIAVHVMVPHDLWPVAGNSTQLHQVLLNLCVNARDAMPNGGELTLAADNVDLSPEEANAIPQATPGPYVMILVSDTGTGIPPETLPRIFEPFFTTKEPGKGTGLGLSTIARIVRNHGGCVNVRSEMGVGTGFEVYLPRAASIAATSVVSETPELPQGNGEGILLLEDDRSVREMVAASLVDQGYRVASAATGAEALAILEEKRSSIKLVLADLTMPPVEGIPPVQAIRARQPDLPVILMSGELESSDNAGSVGALAFLTKPFRLEQLLAAVARGLSSSPPEAQPPLKQTAEDRLRPNRLKAPPKSSPVENC